MRIEFVFDNGKSVFYNWNYPAKPMVGESIIISDFNIILPFNDTYENRWKIWSIDYRYDDLGIYMCVWLEESK